MGRAIFEWKTWPKENVHFKGRMSDSVSEIFFGWVARIWVWIDDIGPT